MGAFDDLIPAAPSAPAGGGNAFADLIPAKPEQRTVGAAMAVSQRPPAWASQNPATGDERDRVLMEDPGAALPNARATTTGRAMPPAPAPAPKEGRSWSDVPGEAFRNLPASAGNFVGALVQPILHPYDTAKSLVALGDAVGSKISRPGNLLRVGDPEPTPEELKARAARELPADAVAQFFSDRYGSVEGLKNTLATDPVGAAADAATVLTGGSMLPTRIAPALGRAGAMIDPVTQTGNALKLGGRAVEPVVSNVLGGTTGAGPEAVRAAGRAGMEGGEAAQAFTQNMRGNVPIEEIVDTAKSALEQIRQERANAYKAGKADLSKDRTILDFNDIDGKVAKASEVGTFKGQTTEPKAVAITQEMTDSINAWKQLDPAEFHTPEGLDALKRRLGNIRDATPERSPERVAADRIYRAVRDEVAAQAPGYAKMMEDYAQSSEKIKEVSKTFSLGEKATGDTAARKLQSATRDGAQTSWRKRGELLDELAQYEPTLPYAISGQAMNALAPRGLVGRGGAMAIGTGATVNPLNLAMIPAFSPRLVGEATYGAGRAANALAVDPALARAVLQGQFQAGRADQIRSRALALRADNALRP